MVRKSNIKNEEIEENKDIFKIWAGGYTAVSKMWEDSYEKVYRPWLESSGEMFDKTALISKEAAPQKYTEFYDEWIKTYQNTFGKLYPIPTPQSNKEIIEKFLSRTDESNKLIKSWIDELEENFRKTKDILGDEPDPAKYKECNDLWMKSYEKIFENLLKLPSEKNTKELFGEYAGITDFYQDGFLQLSKLWKRSYTQICEPMNESMLKLSEKMSEISQGDASPESYKEFYSLWVDGQKEIFEKYGKSNELYREMFENFIGATDIYLGMYKSWIAALEEMSGKAQELSKQSTG
ncbi:MAG: poly(R)-hydroxyalkanoic acid synthase subunit PhaE, partial [Candidatus Methanoperedens sp.]